MCIPGLHADQKQDLMSYAMSCDSYRPQISQHLCISCYACEMEIEHLVNLT